MDEVVAWSSEEREVLGKPIYMSLVGSGLICFVVSCLGSNTHTPGFSGRNLQGHGKWRSAIDSRWHTTR